MVRLLFAALLTASLTGSEVEGRVGSPQQTDRPERLQEAYPSIIPLPQDYVFLDGALRLSSLQRIVLGRGATPGDRFAAGLIQEELRKLDVQVTIDYEGPETSDSASIVIQFASETPEEGYHLHVSPSGALIEGSGERGRFYGAMSMLQLIRGAAPDVPALRVVDYPAFALRGVLDEVSFQLPTLQEFRRVIRFLGEHKVNVYAMPVEEIFRFEIDRTAGMGSVSADEFIELQDFAESYHVEIVPVFRTLGRLERLLRLPEYAGVAEFPGAATPNTQDSAAYDLMETLLDEIVPVFRSTYLHIGGALSDEVGVGASAAAVEAEGAVVVHLKHYRRIYDLVRSRGKVVMMDADLLEHAGERRDELTALVPPDVILVDALDAANRFRSTGLEPDAYRGGTPFRVLRHALRPWGRIFPMPDASSRDLAKTTSSTRDLDAAGVIAAGWAADGAPLLRGMQYREYAYAAEAAWNLDSGAGIDKRFNLQFFGVDGEAVRDIARAVERLTAGVTFPALWHHPLHRIPSGPTAGQATHVSVPRDSSDRVLTAIEDVQRRVARGGDRLDYDAFAVRFSGWLSESSELASWMTDVQLGRRHGDLELGAAWAGRLAGEARSLAQAFRSLWLRTNREVYLERVMEMFRYQVAYLERIEDGMSRGTVDVPTTAPSRFIRAADGADASLLRTTFSLERGQIADAHLQVTGLNDVEVWLNGDRIGRVVGADGADLEVWNVASRLRSGSNVFAARAVRRGASAPGTANVYLEIHFVDGRVRHVVSDQQWKAVAEAPAHWLHDSFSDLEWPPAVQDEDAPTLTLPMFDQGLPSRIEMERIATGQ